MKGGKKSLRKIEGIQIEIWTHCPSGLPQNIGKEHFDYFPDRNP